MTIEPERGTKPAAGVIATRPATAPVIAPNTVGFPTLITSIMTHTIIATAAAVFETRIAEPASPLAARADPPLNPIHPNHKNPAPKMEYPKLCGSNEVSFLFPSISASARAENPEFTSTATPPAKSIAPKFINHPPPQIQWHTGM